MKLIVFSGLPGTGKSALAEHLGRELNIPVFAKDWLEATLLSSELVPTKDDKPLGSAGYQLLTVLAQRQLVLGQSAILDSVASTKSIRSSWKELASKYRADWLVIECICSDEKIHRERMNNRQRHITGWYELSWSDVEAAKSYYAPWDEPRLVIDSINSIDGNLIRVMDWLENNKESSL